MPANPEEILRDLVVSGVGIAGTDAARLAAQAALADLIGDAFRPIALAADDAPPFVAYEFTESPIGTLAGSASWKRAGIKIDCFATSYSEATEIRRLLKAVLHNLTTVEDGVEFRPVRHEDGSDQDLTERAAPGQSARLYRLTSDYKALFRNV